MAKILVLDDRPIHRQFLIALLRHFGHELLEANDGIDALEKLRTCLVDLVIADVLMPMMDGYNFLQRLRADPGFERTPIVLYSAAAYESKARADAETLGVRHFLTKPAEPEQILAAVNSALGLDPSHIEPAPLGKLSRHLLQPPAEPIDPNATVFVVDDDSVMRKFVPLLFREANLKVESFATAEEFLEAYDANQPGCLLLDICLPGMSGIALLEILRSRRDNIPAVVLSGHSDTPTAVRAMKLHALDFLEKPADGGVLETKIYQALQADSIRRREDAKAESIRKRMAILTAREKELVKLLVAGKTSKEIAAQLRISVKTVSNHRANLMAKTHAENMADLVRMSMAALDK